MITQMGNIKIEIQRRKIKNMYLYQTSEGRCSCHCTDENLCEEVFRFLKKKEQWILKNHEKMKNQKHFNKRRFR